MKIVFTFAPSMKNQQFFVERYHEFSWGFYHCIDEATPYLEEAEVIVTYGEDLTGAHIEKARHVKWINVVSAGLEKMPFAAIAERGILVTNARGIHAIPMAEYTLGVMLQHAKKFKELERLAHDEDWNRKLAFQELYGKTVLIVGAGAIGTRIGELAKAFSMHVIGVNTSGTLPSPFDEAYSTRQLNEEMPYADFLVSVLPSTEETINFWHRGRFTSQTTPAVFINIGRGDAVEEAVLIEVLNSGELAHAYLDVFMTEPLPKNHPFWSHEKVTVTPHISSITKNYLPRSFELFEKNLKEYVNGTHEYTNKIDVKRGY